MVQKTEGPDLSLPMAFPSSLRASRYRTGTLQDFTQRMDGEAQERALHLPLVWGREKPRPEEMAPTRADEIAAARAEPVVAPTDEELLQAVSAGDKDAFAQLFDRYAQLLYRVVYRVVDDHGEAEELVQEVFLRLFERAVQFDPAKGAAKPWMVRVAYNRALDRRTYLARRRFRAGTNLDLVAESIRGGQDLEEEFAAKAHRAEVEQTLEDLPEKQRVALQLYFFEGLELKEIAEKMGETLANVRHHYYRGLERLRKSAFAEELRNRLK
jgi:RNA polymerase sigma-70 factor, ECF subfamily